MRDRRRALARPWRSLALSLAHAPHPLAPPYSPPPRRACLRSFRIYRYYLPVYVWLLGRLEAHRAAGSPGALVVGISAPQGCGKSTLVAALTSLLCAEGRPCVAASLDDFYLTGAQQEAVAAAHPGNPLLQYRGLPGTHDTGLAGDTLRALRALGGPGGGGGAPAAPPPAPVPVPLYDKSLRGGRGDRAPARDWPLARAPLAVVLFEGWSLGFRPLPPAALASAVASPASAAHLAPVNAFLAPYGASMDGVACAWLLLRVKDPSWVFGWRAQAEAQLRASGRPGLSDAQVADFVARFMPAYEAYLPQLYAEGPAPAGGAPTLALDVDQDRGLAGAQAMGGDGRAAGGR